jgi:hypothetical protein
MLVLLPAPSMKLQEYVQLPNLHFFCSFMGHLAKTNYNLFLAISTLWGMLSNVKASNAKEARRTSSGGRPEILGLFANAGLREQPPRLEDWVGHGEQLWTSTESCSGAKNSWHERCEHQHLVKAAWNW